MCCDFVDLLFGHLDHVLGMLDISHAINQADACAVFCWTLFWDRIIFCILEFTRVTDAVNAMPEKTVWDVNVYYRNKNGLWIVVPTFYSLRASQCVIKALKPKYWLITTSQGALCYSVFT